MSDEVNIEQTEAEDTQCAEPESAKNSEASEPAEEKKDRKQKKEAAQLSRELEKALKELDKTRKDLEEERDRFIRLAADFDNYKKRTSAEKETLRGAVVCDTMQMMLPIVDNIERALAAAAESSPLRDGVDMVYNQAMSAFEKFGIERFGARGDVFDPNIHNAVMTCDDEELDSGAIADVLQPGYRIGDRIIRHALVKVVN